MNIKPKLFTEDLRMRVRPEDMAKLRQLSQEFSLPQTVVLRLLIQSAEVASLPMLRFVKHDEKAGDAVTVP